MRYFKLAQCGQIPIDTDFSPYITFRYEYMRIDTYKCKLLCMPTQASSIICTCCPQHIMKCYTCTNYSAALVEGLWAGSSQRQRHSQLNLWREKDDNWRLARPVPVVLQLTTSSSTLWEQMLDYEIVMVWAYRHLAEVPVVGYRWSWLWLRLAMSTHSTAGHQMLSWGSNLSPRKPVACVNERKEHNWMVPLIVVELGPSIGRTMYAKVLAIQGT